MGDTRLSYSLRPEHDDPFVTVGHSDTPSQDGSRSVNGSDPRSSIRYSEDLGNVETPEKSSFLDTPLTASFSLLNHSCGNRVNQSSLIASESSGCKQGGQSDRQLPNSLGSQRIPTRRGDSEDLDWDSELDSERNEDTDWEHTDGVQEHPSHTTRTNRPGLRRRKTNTVDLTRLDPNLRNVPSFSFSSADESDQGNVKASKCKLQVSTKPFLSHNSDLEVPTPRSADESEESGVEINDYGSRLAVEANQWEQRLQKPGNYHAADRRRLSFRDLPLLKPTFETTGIALEDELAMVLDGVEDRLGNGGSQIRFKGFFPRDVLFRRITNSVVEHELRRTFPTEKSVTITEYAAKICEDRMCDKEKHRHYKGVGNVCHCHCRRCKGRLSVHGGCSCGSLRRIFTVLVFIGQLPLIRTFLEQGISDAHLPLVKCEQLEKPNLTYLQGKRDESGSVKYLTCSKQDGWASFFVRSFLHYQWATLSPFLSKGKRKDVKRYVLHHEAILPFKEESLPRPADLEGGGGRVTKVYIHPEHHNFHPDPFKSSDLPFAVKQLFSQDQIAFDREVDILRKFSDNAHDHLISLLATFQQSNNFFMIFPWAEGDLHKYWAKLNPTPVVDHPTVLWVAKQCEGIMEGVQKIHQYRTSRLDEKKDDKEDDKKDQEKGLNSLDPSTPKTDNPEQTTEDIYDYGRHGDIKPENVLWFPGPEKGPGKNSLIGGTLKLTDFGLAEFNNDFAKSNVRNSQIGNTPSYRAPECDLFDGKIGTSYDIWTLGCLYLEFATWLLGGWNLLQRFVVERQSKDPFHYNIRTDTFFEIVRLEDSISDRTIAAMVKPAVTEFIRELHRHPNCSEFIHEFLNLIQESMLVVKNPDPQERDRHTSLELHTRLSQMLHKCEEDAGYACSAVDRDPNLELDPSIPVGQVLDEAKKDEWMQRVLRTISKSAGENRS